MVTAAELTRICSACGFCCNGTIFAAVELTDDEVPAALRNRLPVIQPVVAGDASFPLPCPRYLEGSGCTIYEERPRACRKFVCGLLEAATAGTATVERQIERANRARSLVARCKGRGVDFKRPAQDSVPKGASGPVGTEEAELMLDLVELHVTLARDYQAERR